MNSSKQQGLKAPRNGDVPLPPEVRSYNSPYTKKKNGSVYKCLKILEIVDIMY